MSIGDILSKLTHFCQVFWCTKGGIPLHRGKGGIPKCILQNITHPHIQRYRAHKGHSRPKVTRKMAYSGLHPPPSRKVINVTLWISGTFPSGHVKREEHHRLHLESVLEDRPHKGRNQTNRFTIGTFLTNMFIKWRSPYHANHSHVNFFRPRHMASRLRMLHQLFV